MMTSDMNHRIRRATGHRDPRENDIMDHLGTHITPDNDQGMRNTPAPPPISEAMNTRIRRAAGLNIRPGQKPTPWIGDTT